MKKSLWLVAVIVLAVSLTACGSKNNNNSSAGSSDSAEKTVTLKIGASAEPHAKILEFIKPKLEKQGVKLDIVEFNDFVQPNVQVFEKKLDANFFQHQPYLDQFNKDHKENLVKVANVHVEPMGAYSDSIKKLDELKDGAKVGIPNDPTNGGRALILLEKYGLIKLKDGVGIAATVHDIVENKKNLKFTELDAAMLPRTLNQFDLSVINTNYALQANLSPTKDALIIEDKDSPYANILVARPDNKDSEAIQKLAEQLNSQEVKDFIDSTYKGAIVPAF